MPIVNVSVINKVATASKRSPKIVCGNSDYVVKFTFDDEWSGYDKKYARFVFSGVKRDVEFSGDECPIPKIEKAEVVEIGVWVGGIATTTAAVVECELSILCRDVKEPLPEVAFIDTKDIANGAVNYDKLSYQVKSMLDGGSSGGGGGSAVIEDKSIGPRKLYKSMDFNSIEDNRRTFTFREGDLKVADEAAHMGYPVLHAGSKGYVGTDQMVDQAVTNEKIADGTITPKELAGEMNFNMDESDRKKFIFREGDLKVSPADNFSGYNVLHENSKVSNIADGAVKTSNIADKAILKHKIADGAVTYEKLSDDVKAKIDENASIAKGANAGLGFETVAKMNAYIASKKLPSYEGTIPAGSYIVISCDFELAELEVQGADGLTELCSASFAEITIGGRVVRDDYEIHGANGEPDPIYTKSNRYYIVYRVLEDCEASDVSWRIYAYNAGSADFASNGRLTVIETEEPTVDDILAYDIPYATSMYIEDKNVPDYWWDGAKALELETQKIDLTNYVKSVNGKTGAVDLTADDVGAVPVSRTINGNTLGEDIRLTADDIGAVPASATINGKPLRNGILLNADDVGAENKGAASAAITEHNTNEEAHADIRGEIEILSSEIDEVKKQISGSGDAPEIIITENMTGFWWNDNGVPTFYEDESACSKETNYISVEKGDTFSVTARVSDANCFTANGAWYDTDKNLISAIIVTGDYEIRTMTFTAPVGASYVRFFSMNWGSDLSKAPLEVSYLGNEATNTASTSPLKGKKIVYDGDSICSSWGESRNGGAYPQIIANIVEGTFDNQGVGGGRIVTAEGSSDTFHSIVDNLVNLPKDGDLYCFEGGVNDHWHGVPLGTFSESDYTGTLDKTTFCGALETIFRYAQTNFVGKPICYIITHKCPTSAFSSGYFGSSDTFADFREKALGICEKYSIPVYDAWKDSGINSWNAAQLANFFIVSESTGTGDGTHPNEAGYRRYYVPQLIDLFERIMPIGVTDVEPPEAPSYTNVLDTVGWKKGYYLSNGGESVDANASTTGFIPVPSVATIYLENVIMPDESSHGNRVAWYREDKSFIAQMFMTSSYTDSKPVFGEDGNLRQFNISTDGTAYIRLSAWNIDETSIITVNEPIE